MRHDPANPKRRGQMAAHIHTLRSVTGIAAGYLGTGFVALASFALGTPLTYGIAAAYVAYKSRSILGAHRKMIEEQLVAHPRSPDYSPHLGEIADDLAKKAGLPVGNVTVYELRRKPEVQAASKKDENDDTMIDLMGQTNNAASYRNGDKIVIMASRPLLKLLDDNEERAVLAHEFAHAAAYHTSIGKPVRMLGLVSKLANYVALAGVAVMSGWVGALSSVAGAVVARAGAVLAARKFGQGDLLLKKSAELSLKDYLDKKRLRTQVRLATEAGFAGVLSFFNPLALPLWGAAKLLSAVDKVISSAYSRSMEYNADEGAVALGADPLALASGLKKMQIVAERSRLKAFDGKLPERSKLTKLWLKLGLSHPVTPSRIKRLAKMAGKQGVPKEKIDAVLNAKYDIPADADIPADVLKGLAMRMP